MLRKLTATVVVIVTGSLALASTAFARLTVEVGSGSSTTTTGGGFPWNDVAVGAILAAAVVASLAGVAVYARTRRRSTALHA
jgi:hypothetical protein